MKGVDVRGLEVLAALDGLPSLSAAARRLGVPVSTVSRRLRELEASVGTTLCERTTRRLTLTEPGRHLLAQVREPLAQLSTAVASVTGWSDEAPAGELRIAAAPTVARHLLPQVLPELVERAPQVRVHVSVGAEPVNLLSERIDVALRVGAPAKRHADLIARRLQRSRPVLVASPAYLERRGTPALASDLEDHERIGLSTIPTWELAGRTVAEAMEPRLRVPSADLAHLLCRRGAGLALLPTFLVADDLAKGVLVEVPGPGRASARDVYAVFSRSARRIPRVRLFLDLLGASTTTRAGRAERVPSGRKRLGR